MLNVKLALNICTYKREKDIKKNLELLYTSSFFNPEDKDYYGRLHIFVIDNASELVIEEHEFLHVFNNRNTGGSGGFQRGIEEIRKYDDFTHVIFMDDDVIFELSCFYILYDFLKEVEGENALRPVAGRMFDKDNPSVQYTAAEIWNKGNIKHVEFMRDISDGSYTPGKVIYDSGAEYGGFWFCCYPMAFVRENDIFPFFLHCDDVEYGLRCGKSPIIIEGVHIWHETWEKRYSPTVFYYDIRNSLLVNELYNLKKSKEEIISEWKSKIGYYHAQKNWNMEYMGIKGAADYLKGCNWIKRLNNERYQEKLIRTRGNRMKNALTWRLVLRKIYKYSLEDII